MLKDADLAESDSPAVTAKKSHTVIPGTVADLVAAGLLRAGVELHLAQGGRVATATVSTSGELIVDGVAYASPSKAAATALGLQSSNGWTTWHVENSAGPTLAQLRLTLRQTQNPAETES